MYRSHFTRDLFSDLDRLQRDLQQAFDLVGQAPGIRGLGRGGYPALNVGDTPTSVEVYAVAPGLDPARIEVNLERGVLTLSGERASALPEGAAARDNKTAVHLNERFSGRFRRVISLPDDIDPNAVEASYRDGVLHVSVARRAAPQPQRITVQ